MSVALIPQQIREIMCELVRRSGLQNTCVEIICTRGSPTPGPLTQKLNEACWALHNDPEYSVPVDYRGK